MRAARRYQQVTGPSTPSLAAPVLGLAAALSAAVFACTPLVSDLVTERPSAPADAGWPGLGRAGEGGKGGLTGAPAGGLAGAAPTGAAGTAGTAPAVPPAVVAAIDERPGGGASLTTGTTGGGTYADALAAGAVRVVASLEELSDAVSGDAPAVVLVAEGSYFGSGSQRTFEVCSQPCTPATPVAAQTIVSAYCTNGEALFSVDVTYATLRVGSHKTVLGLGAGAVLRNVQVDLGGSTNVILRNLALEDLAPGVARSLDALLLWPSDHVWIDHVTFRNLPRAYLNIVSSWDEENDQALTIESGFVTLTHCDFDGTVTDACAQRSDFVFGTSRNPALTVAQNWFHGSLNRNTYLFGPGTWGHVFNNYWADIDHSGLAVACGATGLAQGNVFADTQDALYNNDDGVPTWKFCAAGFFGQLYAPTASGDEEANLLDAHSTMSLHDQPSDGAGLILPRRLSGHDFEVSVPVERGARTESYVVTLAADPTTVPEAVRASAGVGRMF